MTGKSDSQRRVEKMKAVMEAEFGLKFDTLEEFMDDVRNLVLQEDEVEIRSDTPENFIQDLDDNGELIYSIGYPEEGGGVMLVRELIEQLKTFPQDCKVVMLSEKPIGVCFIDYNNEPLVYITEEEEE